MGFLQQRRMRDVIKATCNISFQYMFKTLADDIKAGLNRILTRPSWPESIDIGFKLGFPFGFERKLD
jgi:hypothetical protein